MKLPQQHIVLQTENLSVGYVSKKEEKVVVSNINLSIEKGKFVAILGKNGIGKSTLLKTISKVQKPINGHIFINEKNINLFTNKELATALSLVLTERLPESQLTAFELIALGRQPHTNWIDQLSEKDIEKINWTIDLTEISHLKNQKLYQLSDGQLQRVLIARALAQDTPIIILDEPTVHLDIHQTTNLFLLLKKLVNTTKKTIIISTHEVNLAIKLTDELILLSETKTYNGTVNTLIEKNAFDSLFSKKHITFNKTLQQFVINTYKNA